MSETKNLNNKEAIDKLKNLVDEINICLFCTNLKTDDGSKCSPMTVQKVCDQGNVWFFSEKNSDKNEDIVQNKSVQLFFFHPGKNSYLVVNGDAEIIIDRKKIEELWSPLVKLWFPEGKDDPNLSIIKVKPTTAYCWDVDGNKMINFLKRAASVGIGKNLLTGKECALSI